MEKVDAKTLAAKAQELLDDDQVRAGFVEEIFSPVQKMKARNGDEYTLFIGITMSPEKYRIGDVVSEEDEEETRPKKSPATTARGTRTLARGKRPAPIRRKK